MKNSILAALLLLAVGPAHAQITGGTASGGVAAGSIDTTKLAPGAVDTTKLVNGAVDTIKLAPWPAIPGIAGNVRIDGAGIQKVTIASNDNASELHIQSDGAGDPAGVYFDNGGTNQFGIAPDIEGNRGGKTLGLTYTGGNTIMQWSNQTGTVGNVGIGVPFAQNPRAKLHVVGDSSFQGAVTVGDVNTTSSMTVTGALSANSVIRFKNSTWEIGQDNTCAGAYFYNGGYRTCLLPTGNFGIGNTNPATKLHMSSGTLTIDGNTGLGLNVNTTGTSPSATFSPVLSSNTVTSTLSGTYTNTTLGACISGSTLTLNLPISEPVLVTMNGTASVNSLAAVLGAGIIVDGGFVNSETKAKGLTAPQEAVSTDGTNIGFTAIVTGLASGAHNICLSLFVSAGTGTIDSTNSAMTMTAVMLP